MKKLMKFVGLALLAVLLIAGCKKEPDWEDVTELTLSDGTWSASSRDSREFSAADAFNAFVASAKTEEDPSQGITVTSNGTTVTETHTYSAAQLAGVSYTKEQFISRFAPKSGLQANKDRTQYRYYKSEEQGGLTQETEMTIAKQ